MKTSDFRAERNRLIDPWWRKARIAARLLLKKEQQSWSARDRRLAVRLANDPGVTNRLIDQAVHSLTARRKYGPGILGWFR